MRTGWEYNQSANTDDSSTPLKHLRFDLIFYLTTKLQATSTMDIFRLYYNQSMFEMPQIQFKLDVGAIWTEKGQYCPHLSWSRGSFGINTTYRQEFMNCSKTIVGSPWDFEGVWTGKYAKWFEECARSQAGTANSADPQVTATFWKIDWLESVSERVLLGTVDPTSATNCYNIPLFSSPGLGPD